MLSIEEWYVVRDSSGREITMKVTRDAKMNELPKIGDSIAAQLTSQGTVEAIGKLDPKALERQDIAVPLGSQGGLR